MYSVYDNRIEHDILKAIYDYRVLTYLQIVDYLLFLNTIQFYPKNNEKNRVAEALNNLLNRECIKIQSFDFDKYCFILTAQGHKLIANVDETLVSDKITDKYITYSNYKFKDNKILNHQIHLNNCVIHTFKNLKKNKVNYQQIQYFDEKNFLKDSSLPLRPDGVLLISDVSKTVLYFLEMDMSTESLAQLSAKWDRYYALSKMLAESNKAFEIKMIFIALEQSRLDVVKKGLQDKYSLMKSNKISCYLTTFSETASFITNDILNISDNSYYINLFYNLLQRRKGRINSEKQGFSIKIDEKDYTIIQVNNDFNNLADIGAIYSASHDNSNILFYLNNIKYEDFSANILKKIFKDYNIKDTLIKKQKIFFTNEDLLKRERILKINYYDLNNYDEERI